MRVEINGTVVAMDADTMPAFSYSLFDTFDPTTVRGGRSTTFTIPATAEARSVFGAYTLAEQKDTDYEMVVYGDGIETFRSKVILTAANAYQYECVAVNDNAEWINEAKGSSLRTLPLGNAPIVTETEQERTWTDETATVRYPLIDYGSFEQRPSSYDVQVEEIRPAVSIHAIVTAIFQGFGYSVNIKGSLNKLWRKLVLAYSGPEIKASGDVVVANTATVGNNVGNNIDYGIANQELAPNVVTSDPGGNIVSFRYVAPFKGTVEMDFNGTFEFLFSALGSPAGATLQLRNATTGATGLFVRINMTSLNSIRTVIATLPKVTCDAGDEIILVISVGINPYATWISGYLRDGWRATFRPVDIEYGPNISFDIASTLPDMSQGDFLKGLANWLNLTFATNDQTGQVTIQYYPDLLKDISQGIDFSERVDFTRPLTVNRVEVPARYLFEHKRDDKDRGRIENEETSPENIFGDLTYDLGGTGKDELIEVPFAATYNGSTFENVTVPTIWKDGATYQTSVYECVPRILVMDGTDIGLWTWEGVGQDIYPVSYFMLPGEAFNLSFSDEKSRGATVSGTVSRAWVPRLRTIGAGVSVAADLFIWSHELNNFDVGTPRWVHDGLMGGWYYVTEISDKVIGTPGPCECTLMPV